MNEEEGRELNAAEKAVAQYMAIHVRHLLGTNKGAKKVGVDASVLYKWSIGVVSPTRAKFRKLQLAYESTKGPSNVPSQ